MKSISLCFALLGAAACCHAQQSAPVHAVLRAEASAEGRTVLLGDIAELSGAPADKLTALARTPLAAAPQPGYSLHLSRREVGHLLAEAGVRGLVLDGAEATSVTMAAAPFDPDLLVAKAKEILGAKLAHEGRTLELSAAGALPMVRLPRGSVTLQARDDAPEQPRSRMTVWIDMLLDGVFYRSEPVVFKVEARENVLVARTDLNKGMSPDCTNLEAQLRDIAALPAPPEAGRCDALQRRLRRHISAGEVLLAGELENIPAVSEGDYVTLKVKEGAVLLESRALAITDGAIGQRIPVKPETSDEPVLATVIAPGLVNFSGR
ncbi:MAG: flagellar basal body P-ring formation protein FlgA [Burkholderiaceae bacterium]|nr:flagellar basal body P-ring formation protein FlgA [Burkholderiaceae bacterium]